MFERENPHHQAIPAAAPLFINGRGMSTAALRQLPPDQLIARYRQLHSYLCRWNVTPRRLRAQRDANARKQDHIAANELARLKALAHTRGITLTLPAPALSPPAERPIQAGDRVHAEYRNPETGSLEARDGTIVRIEYGKFGAIYLTRLDHGQVLCLERRALKLA